MVIIKTKKEIGLIREGGKILAGILDRLVREVEPGTTTGQLEELACSLMAKAGGRPAFKGYGAGQGARPFPTALCTSVNDQVVHTPAFPARRLEEGDIIGIDIGIEYKGYYTDMAATVPVGRVSGEAGRLIEVTRESLNRGIAQVRPGKTLKDIGRAIQTYVEANGFSVVRQLVGHGVGREVHEDPQIPNFVIENKRFNNVILKEGMVIAIEPMVNVGDFEVETAEDGFSIVTTDGSLSAHFEHTIAVTKNGYEILTRA